MEKAFLTIMEKAPGVAITILILLVLFRAVPDVIKYILAYRLFKKMIDNGADDIDFYGGKASKSNKNTKIKIDNEGQIATTGTDNEISQRKVIPFSSDKSSKAWKRNRGD